ncbi:MAG: hypothetical protein GXO80_05560 [Chlorobi bacterium]|nr:hypothetical protein [Chlorobiota bacterium]
MKKLLLISGFLFFTVFSYSQDKNISKIEHYYNKGKYDKCISKAKEYILKNKKDAEPYYFIGISYLKEFQKMKDNISVKLTGKYLSKGITKNNHSVYDTKFKSEIDTFHIILKNYAANYYDANKKLSKPYFEYLAKIYNDTLKQYHELFKKGETRPDAEIVRLTEEGKINRKDKDGLKQGKWMKVYSNGNKAYEVYFKDDKPIGEMKRYHENGKLSAVLDYNETGDTAKVKFYDENENLISEGIYAGKKKTGKWIYYQKGVKVKEENFKNDSLHGEQILFYDNGQIYDKRLYNNGIQVDMWTKFYKNGKPFLKAKIVNGKMEGPMLRYYKSGQIEVKGQYKNDLKDGTWTFYGEHGEKDTINYKNGHDVNEKDVEKRESEQYRKNIEKGKHIADPKDFKNNPEDYPVNK